MKRQIRVATRGSLLALSQTRQLVEILKHRNPSVTFEIVSLKTTGDRVTDRPLTNFRGIGVFVKELQNALLENRADIAVHSLKDVPTEQYKELILAGFPERINPCDLLLTKCDKTFRELPAGSTIGTGSPRRMVQLKADNMTLRFSDLRGNLDTRLRKLERGEYDGIVVAAAGMTRLNKKFDAKFLLPVETCIPAVGQGALAVECLKDDSFSRSVAASVNHENTQIAVESERSFLRGVGGGCSMPIAAYAYVKDNFIHINAMVGSINTIQIVRYSTQIPVHKHIEGGKECSSQILALCKKKGVSIY
ncbi:MAG: hydroxymethylbilane synthase [Chitinispirillia bacterium]|jgi:hydroxymethylbilane synthase